MVISFKENNYSFTGVKGWKGFNMEHEFKIVIKYLELEENEILSPTWTKVYVDDILVGTIKNVKLELGAFSKLHPKLEVTFPSLTDYDVLGAAEEMYDKIQDNVNKIRKIPGTIINYK